MSQNKGGLIVITGPSGVGKGTLLSHLCDRYPELFAFSVSVTTRPPRPHEVEGREYYFWQRDKFMQACQEGFFLEWAEYAGNLYGTPKAPVEAMIQQGKWVLLEIDLTGARQIARTFPQAMRIFIAPPSLVELEARLRKRSTEPEEVIAQRLHHATIELAALDEFDYVIVNDDLEESIDALENAIFGEQPWQE
ncbi:MAG: guanylate kinase [Cyanobacteria bacterium KgW148]|nr:guanylate kinase [Cyanobacteria bacterium KgW148]